MMLRTVALALAAAIGTAMPAAGQGRLDQGILPPDVISTGGFAPAAPPTRSLAPLDSARGALSVAERAGTPMPRSARADRAAQNRNGIERTERSTRTISLGANGLLELRNVAGDITVTVGSGRDVVIETIKLSRANSEAEAARGLQEVQVTIDHRGERVVVDTTYPRGRTPYQLTTPFNVTAPAGTRLNARSVSGNVTVRGITGDVTVDSVSGTVTISEGGRVSQARSVSGEVHLADLKTDGIVAAGSVSGNVTFQRIRARQVTGETVSGRVRADDVTCDGAQMKSLSGPVEFFGPLARNGRYELNSHSGTVRLAVSGGVGFELQARSFSGRIRPEGLSLQSISTSRGSVRATVGDASAVVIAGTFSGDVVVSRK